jgi:anti-sigma regulatory factor (Ser/Thr protein kinase)
VAAVSVVLSERYPASASSVSVARHDVSDALATAGFSDPDLQDRVAVVLSEATGNVVCHAYPEGEDEFMEVVVKRAAGAVVVAVTDHRVGMDADVTPPGLGLGLAMMRAQSTSMKIDSDTTGTIVTLRFQAA